MHSSAAVSDEMLIFLLLLAVSARATPICGYGQACGAGAECECLQFVSECFDTSCHLTPFGVGLVAAAGFLGLILLLLCCCCLVCCCRPCQGCCDRNSSPITIAVPVPFEYHQSVSL